MALDPTAFDRATAHLSREPRAIRARVEAMEKLLERMFVLPGTNRQIGLDVLLDMIPVIGPVSASLLGSWMVWEARNLGMSNWQIARMGGNIAVDFVLGAIPLIGAIPDFFFRSNSRNLRIIKRHLDKHHPGSMTVDAVARR